MSNDKKPLILISNDDGIQAKGIQELISSIRSLGEVIAIAPDGPRSGMSSAITSEIPIRVRLIKKEENLKVYSCNGTPVDCIKVGINEILERKPDMVIAGINHGSNSAISVLYSGTMGAAFEGCIFGIPSFGISLTSHMPEADFSEAARYAKFVAKKVLTEGLAKGICLNVNVPVTKDIKGIKICTQTDGKWTAEYVRSQDAGGKTIYWLTGEFDNHSPENQDNDEWALANGFVSIVPCKIDMTAYETIEQIKHWEFINEELKIKN